MRAQIKTWTLRTPAFLACALLWTPLAPAQVSDPDDIDFPALPSAEIPQLERLELANGLVVLLIENHELPLVDARALVRTGARLEPADQVGLASLVGQVLRSGGTRSMASDELDDLLEDHAATIESQIGAESGSVVMSSLTDDLPEMLRVFADILRHPAFEQEKIDVAKTQAISSISRQNDDVNQITGREFRELLYGSDSPYARSPTYATLDAISRDDLVAWHRKYYHPNRVILGLSGDFNTAEALKLVKEVLGDWPKGPDLDDPEAEYRKEPNPGIFYIEKNDVTQSTIRIGHLGIRRDNPDYYAVELMNQLFGGSFASRLFSRVRSKQGLAYNVGGGIRSRWDYPGMAQISMNTKTETTAAGIDSLLEEVGNLRSEPPTAEEVERARAGILNSFVFRADSIGKILNQQLSYEYYGYPLDWQERYRKAIEKVTTAEVREAAAKYFKAADFTILVVGPKEGTDRPLSEFGEVQVVDIEIPEPEAPEVELTVEGRERAAGLIAKAVDGIGGAERLDALRTYRSESAVELNTPQGSMQVKVKAALAFPDRMRQEMVLPFGSMVRVLNGNDSFMQSPQGSMPLPEGQRRELEKDFRRQTLMLLRHRGAADFAAAATGASEVGGTPVELVRVEFQGDVSTLGIDPETGRILSQEFRGQAPGSPPGDLVTTYSDFREVDGLTLPFATTTTFNGKQMMSGVVGSLNLDEPLDDSQFERPAS